MAWIMRGTARRTHGSTAWGRPIISGMAAIQGSNWQPRSRLDRFDSVSDDARIPVTLFATFDCSCQALTKKSAHPDPRARCPGCGYAGPDRPQNPGCAGSEHKDKGACRMVGGKFEGALEPAPGAKPDATGLVWNTLATIRDRPSEEAWTSIASTDSTPYSCE